MSEWDEERDFVIVGSGGGAMAAALLLRDHLRDVLILEKTDMVGGSTAMSGGVLWVPNHPLQAAAGVPDSFDAAMTYLESVVGKAEGASSLERRRAFLTTGPELVTYLNRKGAELHRAEGWSDYYDDRPGGCARGRSLVSRFFDLKELGEWREKLRRSPVTSIPIYSMEGTRVLLANRSLKGALLGFKVALRTMVSKLRGQELRGSGMALQGRLIRAVLDAGAEVRLCAPVTRLVEVDGRVVGVEIAQEGGALRIAARMGVLLNSGGFSHNDRMRAEHLPAPATTKWTHANPGDTGEVLEMAIALGAGTDLLDAVIWTAGTWPPGAPRPRFATINLHKPHLIVVNQEGRRFVNECASYMEVGQAMHANKGVPSYVIFDQQHRSNYPWDSAPPGITPAEWLESGYMKRSDTVSGLAGLIGVPAAALEKTVADYNRGAREGKDFQFHRGERAYDRVWADFTHRPNPTVGAIERAPFYAVELVPSDVGTFGGLLTDADGRVQRKDGSVIEGLYATGNGTASVVGRTYPGAGASIAASMVFGYRAARHALGSTNAWAPGQVRETA